MNSNKKPFGDDFFLALYDVNRERERQLDAVNREYEGMNGLEGKAVDLPFRPGIWTDDFLVKSRNLENSKRDLTKNNEAKLGSNSWI